MIHLRATIRYVSGMRRRWASFGKGRVAKRWARRAFAEFEVSTGRREEMLSSIVTDALHLTKLADELVVGRDGSCRCFVDYLLAGLSTR